MYVKLGNFMLILIKHYHIRYNKVKSNEWNNIRAECGRVGAEVERRNTGRPVRECVSVCVSVCVCVRAMRIVQL